MRLKIRQYCSLYSAHSSCPEIPTYSYSSHTEGYLRSRESATRPLDEEVIERNLQSTHFRSVSPVDESIAVLFISQSMHFENTWPFSVFKSAAVQRISDPVVDVISPHSDAHGDDGTTRMAALCPTNPAATIAVDGIKRRMAKISNGYIS